MERPLGHTHADNVLKPTPTIETFIAIQKYTALKNECGPTPEKMEERQNIFLATRRSPSQEYLVSVNTDSELWF